MAVPARPEQAREQQQSGCYVYGIVPADVESAADVPGVGDPPARVQLVRQGSLAALVSEVDLTRRLGTPEDLRAHAVLAEVLAEIPEAARLRRQIQDKDPDATRNVRIRLGLIINHAITAKRAADTRVLSEVVGPHCVASVVREPTHELDAVHLALLAQITRQDDLEQALSDLASDWAGRIEIRLLGPQAPYDFTPALPPHRIR